MNQGSLNILCIKNRESFILANILRTVQLCCNSCPSVHSKLDHNRRYATGVSNPGKKRNQQDHVNFDTLGTWDNRIELPLELSESIKHGKPIPQISLTNVGGATNIGRRLTNEDRYSVREIASGLLYFAIFDGHGGGTCAEFCNSHMPDHIVSWLQKGENDLKTILENTFQELNNDFSKFTSFGVASKCIEHVFISFVPLRI